MDAPSGERKTASASGDGGPLPAAPSGSGERPPSGDDGSLAVAPYGIGRMLEDTVTAPVRAGAVFTALAGRPAPAYGVMIFNLLAFSAAACAASFIRSAVAMPDHAPYAPALLALAAALLLIVPASFIAAGLLHAFMLLSGGKEDFRRSYQTASLLSLVVVLQAMLNRFDWAWALPSLLAAYLAATAARTLHRAPAVRAAAVFGALAGVCVLGQWWAREHTARWAKTAGELSRQMRQLPQTPLPLAPDGADANLAQGQAPVSGLDLLAAPRGNGPAPAQFQAMQTATADMLRPVLGMLNNPQLAKGLSPEQARQVVELTGLINQMQEAMTGGGNLTPAEQAAAARKFQTLALQLMSQLPAVGKGTPSLKGVVPPYPEGAAGQGTPAAPAPIPPAERGK